MSNDTFLLETRLEEDGEHVEEDGFFLKDGQEDGWV